MPHRRPMIIRPETPADFAAICRINSDAFVDHPHSQQTEHLIVDALRTASALTLSLVAEDEGRVVGHIAFSPAWINGEESRWFVLGPVAVTPVRQGRGIGSRLIEHGIEAIRQSGADGCALVGEPAYYERFGFRRHLSLIVPGIPEEYCLFLPLSPDETMPQGIVTHHNAFSVTRADPP